MRSVATPKPAAGPLDGSRITSVRGAVARVLGSTSEFGRLFSGSILSPVWFRGQASHRWPLEPGIFRRGRNGVYRFDEYQMLGEMRLMRPLEAQTYPTTFDWLVMCQHYGLPTRLLDWTESILIALLFAAEDDDVDGVLFVLKPWLLNSRTALHRRKNLCLPTYPDAILRADQSVCASLEEVVDRLKHTFGRTPFYGKYIETLGGEKRIREVANLPVAVYPPRNNARIVQQSGMFTLHGGMVPSQSHRPDYGEHVSLESLRQELPDVLKRFVVPAATKPRIRSDLARLGIHHGALFPEFEAQARHLRDKWSRRDGPEPTLAERGKLE